MSTRSFIAKKTRTGYEGVYCHWDGYPEKPGVGWVLRSAYTTPSKVNKLIALGDISSLGDFIGKKHKFSDHDLAEEKNWVTAYHRDRGEHWKDVKPKKFATLEELDEHASNAGAEYIYVFEKGRWKTIH